MVRPLQRSILGKRLCVWLRSTSVHRTPRRPRSSARVRPTGPAPTMSTSVESTDIPIIDYGQPDAPAVRPERQVEARVRGDFVGSGLVEGLSNGWPQRDPSASDTLGTCV